MILGNLDTRPMSLKILFLLIIHKLCCWRGWNLITHFLNITNRNYWLLPGSSYLNFWATYFVIVIIIHFMFCTKWESVLSHSGEVTLFVYDLKHVIGNCLSCICILMLRRRDLGDVRESSLQIHVRGLLFVRLNLRVDSMCVYFSAVAQPIGIALSAFVDIGQIRESLCLRTVRDNHHLLCVLLRRHSEGISSSHNKLRV